MLKKGYIKLERHVFLKVLLHRVPTLSERSHLRRRNKTGAVRLFEFVVFLWTKTCACTGPIQQ